MSPSTKPPLELISNTALFLSLIADYASEAIFRHLLPLLTKCPVSPDPWLCWCANKPMKEERVWCLPQAWVVLQGEAKAYSTRACGPWAKTHQRQLGPWFLRGLSKASWAKWLEPKCYRYLMRALRFESGQCGFQSHRPLKAFWSMVPFLVGSTGPCTNSFWPTREYAFKHVE